MSPRVTPKEDLVLENRKMSSSISVQPVTNDAAIVEISPSEEENVNEHLLKNIDEIYSPVLKLMKIFGTFFGETRLKRLKNASGGFERRFYVTRIYCGVVVSGLWLNFVISFVDVIIGNNIFLFLMFSFWCLLVALNGTVSLFVLCVPVADATKSRFEIFICNLLAITSTVDLEKIKSKSRKGIIIICFFIVSSAAGIITTYLTLDITIAAFYPWNAWFGFRVISLIFFIYGEGAWLLPVLFLCITCLILEELFDNLHKQMSPSHSVSANIEALNVEHHKLCELVELADKMLAPLLFGMVSVFIPLVCFNFYKTVYLPEEDTTMFLATNLFWLLTSAGLLATIMLFGSRVSEKIHSFQNILQTFHVSKDDEGKLLTAIQLVNFKLDLQGDPKGLSIGGLVVITKSMSLTQIAELAKDLPTESNVTKSTVGVIVSYFAVMLSLPK